MFEGEEQAIHNSDESYHLCMMFKEKKRWQGCHAVIVKLGGSAKEPFT